MTVLTEWHDQAFLAVLKVKFKNTGLEKIERREFALQETQPDQPSETMGVDFSTGAKGRYEYDIRAF